MADPKSSFYSLGAVLGGELQFVGMSGAKRVRAGLEHLAGVFVLVERRMNL